MIFPAVQPLKRSKHATILISAAGSIKFETGNDTYHMVGGRDCCRSRAEIGTAPGSPTQRATAVAPPPAYILTKLTSHATLTLKGLPAHGFFLSDLSTPENEGKRPMQMHGFRNFWTV